MRFQDAYFNIGYLDTLSYGNTFVHRLDPRIKLIVSLTFILVVVSFPKYALTGLLPFALYPIFLFAAGDIPVKPVIRKIVLLSPFIILVGIGNPLIDTGVQFRMGAWGVSGGWISFLSIVIKFILTTSVAFLLIATSSFIGICEGLQRLRVSDVFVIQMLFLYRYLFVLLEEAFSMMRAREARSFGNKGYGIKPFINLVSVLLVRTLQKAERIHGAMVSRGFQGRITTARTRSITFPDLAFLVTALAVFAVLRFYDLPRAVGTFLMEVLQ
ncbi:MAG: cobalt ECF transporter T component CbiQ [bacterium]